MGVVIPSGFMHVIQPLRLAAAAKDFSITYAVSLAGGSGPQSVIGDLFSAFKTNWAPQFDNSYTLLPSVGYYPAVGGQMQVVQATGASQVGGLAATTPPAQVAVAIRKRTAFVGKAFRGRMYFPGILSEAGVDEAGNVTPAGLALIQGIATEWLSDMDAIQSLNEVVLLHSDAAVPPTTITSLVVQPIVRTQRRRLPRG